MAAFELYFGKRNMVSNMEKYHNPLNQSYDSQSQHHNLLTRDRSSQVFTFNTEGVGPEQNIAFR